MRRSSAISLLLLLAMPFVSPLFATQISELTLPACCRRDGKHHCTARMGTESLTNTLTTVQVKGEKCPANPGIFSITHHSQFSLDVRSAIFADIVSHPSGSPQTQAKRHISLNRSRQKRGPPSIFLS